MTQTRDTKFELQLSNAFGSQTSMTPLLTADRMGRRIHGVDLSQPLSPEQAAFLIDLFDEYQVISFPAQDQHGFQVTSLERLANHFGAPILTQRTSPITPSTTHMRTTTLPEHHQASSRCNAAFPNQIACAKEQTAPPYISL